MPRIGENSNHPTPTTEPTDPPTSHTPSTNTKSATTNDRIENNSTHTLSTPQPHTHTTGLRPPGNAGVHTAAGVSIANGVAAVAVHGAQNVQTPDQQLAELQLLAVASAQKELAAGVREIGNTNTGPRVDEYAKEARMNTGGKWCGYFTNWNYAVAAKDLEGRFKGPSLHSKPKACYSFLYRSYTNDSGSKMRELDTLKANHEAAGSTRQFFVFEGSQGHALAKSLNQPCVIADNYRELDIRPGDTALWDRSHVGMVESYNKETGILVTIEGNLGGRVRRKQYDLTNAADRNQFTGFGRPSLEDFNLPKVGSESSG